MGASYFSNYDNLKGARRIFEDYINDTGRIGSLDRDLGIVGREL